MAGGRARRRKQLGSVSHSAMGQHQPCHLSSRDIEEVASLPVVWAGSPSGRRAWGQEAGCRGGQASLCILCIRSAMSAPFSDLQTPSCAGCGEAWKTLSVCFLRAAL